MTRRPLWRARFTRGRQRITAYAAFGVAVGLGAMIWLTWHLLEPACERLASYAIYPEGD